MHFVGIFEIIQEQNTSLLNLQHLLLRPRFTPIKEFLTFAGQVRLTQQASFETRLDPNLR